MVVLIVDNGAGNAKAGFASESNPRLIPNRVTKAKTVRTRAFVGDQIDDCKDFSGLFYLLPFQKGYLVNWEIEKQVWDYTFSKSCLKVDFDDTDLIITEPLYNFTTVQESMTEILFEEYGFNSVLKCTPSYLSQLNYNHNSPNPKPVCTLVVDCGYSSTHIVPFYKGKRLDQATCRIDVGGKLLTNHLKEIISYRQLNVMDETHVINQCKEDICFVSQDFKSDMMKAKSRDASIVRDYVLPDYTQTKRGYVKTDSTKITNEQLLRLNNERFSVPEVLFHPSDIGIDQMGLSEAIVRSISYCDKLMRPHMSANIVLTGGNCLFQGFKSRVFTDVRRETDSFYDVKVTLPESPAEYAWQGGRVLAAHETFEKWAVTRAEYDEDGLAAFQDKQFEVLTQ